VEQLSLRAHMAGDWAVLQLPASSAGLWAALSRAEYAVPLLPPRSPGAALLSEEDYRRWVACVDVTDRRLRVPILSRGEIRLRRKTLLLPRLLACYAGIRDTALLTWGGGELTLTAPARPRPP
jgi:hypothetical protein